MAKFSRRFIDNIDGRYYVDEACIDCDLCRQTAPDFFKRSHIGAASHSIVQRQPVTAQEVAACEDALQACPVNAIGKCEQASETRTESSEEKPEHAAIGAAFGSVSPFLV
ncbi:MAG TPA: ferredoxin [Methylomirabilota bacterium]|nr:ferredoxin [Methylomirabilota bacterium]